MMVRGIPPRTRVRDEYRMIGARTRGRGSPSPPKTWGKVASAKKPVLKIQVERRGIDELHVDIFNEIKEVVILIEAPGLERDHLTVTLGNPVLILNINGSPRYGKGELRIKLPCKVNKRPPPQLELANGIVKITLRKPAGRNKKCHDS